MLLFALCYCSVAMLNNFFFNVLSALISFWFCISLRFPKDHHQNESHAIFVLILLFSFHIPNLRLTYNHITLYLAFFSFLFNLCIVWLLG